MSRWGIALALANAVAALMDYGFDPQQAVEVARWTSSQPNQAANWPHDGNSGLD